MVTSPGKKPCISDREELLPLSKRVPFDTRDRLECQLQGTGILGVFESFLQELGRESLHLKRTQGFKEIWGWVGVEKCSNYL